VNLTVERSQSRSLDYLALTYPLTERLDLVGIFNGHCALAPQAENDNGVVLTAMTHSRLAPTPVPLMHMPAWAENYAICELYSRPASAFNDDACGRALDALYPVLPQVWVEILGRVRSEFGLNLSVLHTDVTLIQVEGHYEDARKPDPGVREPAEPRHGRTPKGFDSRRKQVALSMSVTPQGLPAWWLAHDGNVADPQVYQQHLFALRVWLQQLRPIMVGDSKLPTEENRLAFHRAGAYYVGPATLRREDRQALQRLWQSGATCDQLVWRDQGPKDKGRFWGLASKEERRDPDDPARTYSERTVFVFSRDERRTIRHARAKALWKARAALRHVRAQLNRGRYKTRSYILQQLNQRLGSGASFVTYQLDDLHDEAGQTRFHLNWQLDHQALREAAEFDGWYRLLTNAPETEYPMGEVLALYKGQAHAEGAFKQVKHWPIQVSPLWLHQPARIEALLGLTAIALLLTAVLAHQLRQAIDQQPEPPTGLQPEGRDHLPVTSRRMWQIMVGLRLMLITMSAPDGTCWQLTTVDTPGPAQETVLHLLGWPQPNDYLPVGLRPVTPAEKCGKTA
jgi:hypothetical protein